MSSKGKRLSILKKQHALPEEYHHLEQSVSGAIKSGKKIEFNRKKSVKEFLVGEDVDTIWGNSYEVSTDGTPSSAFSETVLGSNNSTHTTVNEQNKENQPTNQKHTTEQLDNSTYCDLSVTIVDDERRRIRNEGSIALSQSLNMTERVLLEPSAPTKLRLQMNGCSVDVEDVLPMDISPLKPSALHPSPSKSPRKMIYNFPKQAMFVEINDVAAPPVAADESKTAARSSLWRGTNQSTLRGNSSAYVASETWNSHPNHNAGLQHTYQANVSSDVDTTIALTAAMTKVLESCSNESIQKATNMDLDESTLTLPTNALARARPSFLPTVKQFDDTATQHTPTIGTASSIESINPDDLSSPLERHMHRANNLSLENLSILQTPPTDKDGVRSSRITLDLGLSGFSLAGRPSSPLERRVEATKPRILRPTLPFTLLAEKEPKQATPTNESANVVSMDISSKGVSTHSRAMHTDTQTTTQKEEKEKRKHSRSTDFYPHDIVDDRSESDIPHRGTVFDNEKMEVATIVNVPLRQTANEPESIIFSPQKALDTYRRTMYQLDDMKQDAEPRKAIVSNESMVCSTTPPKCGQHIEEVSVHVTRGNQSTMDVKFQLEPMEQSRAKCTQRLTTCVTQTMEEDTSPCKGKAINSARNTPFSHRKSISIAQQMDVTSHGDVHQLLQADARDQRLTIHATEVMDESVNVQQLVCVNVEEIRQKPRQESRIPRLTTHQHEDMEHEKQQRRIESKPRRTIHEQEDMDLTSFDVEEQKNEVNLPSEPKVEQKSRKTMYDRVDMDRTNSDLKEMQNEDMLLENRVLQPGHTVEQKTRMSLYDRQAMELTRMDLEERKRNDVLQDDPKAQQKTRHTISKREDMDLTKTNPEEVRSLDGKMKNEPMVRQLSIFGRVDMDTTASNVGDAKGEIMLPSIPTVRHKPRMSTYERADMDVTATYLKPIDNADTLPAQPETQQQAGNIISERDKMDITKKGSIPKAKAHQMSRMSVYERKDMDLTVSDHQDGTSANRSMLKNEPKVDKTSRTSLYEVEGMDTSAVGQTIHEPGQLKRYTETGKGDHDVTNYSTFLERYEDSLETTTHGASTSQRPAAEGKGKTFNCTRLPDELDCLPESIMIEPNGGNKTARQGEIRKTINHPEAMERTTMAGKECISSFSALRKSIANGMDGVSLLVNDETEAPKSRRSIYDPTAMVEATAPIHTEWIKSHTLERPHVKQQLQQQDDCRMDETILPGNVRVERASREPMPESPFVCPAEHPPSTTKVVTMGIVRQGALENTASMDLTLGAKTVTPPPQLPPDPEIRHRWRPRQTILIPQDMDVDDETEPAKEPQLPTLSNLVRETTEDRVLRSASVLPMRHFQSHEEPSLVLCPAVLARQESDPERKTTHNKVRPVSVPSELCDISVSFSSVTRPELPHVGNMTGMMDSMREITEPLPPQVSFQEQSNSVSVICRTSELPTKQDDFGVRTMAFVPSGEGEPHSDDEFYDAEERQEVDPLSLTRSRHLTMKFVDVEQLERTSKRLHSEVLASPMVSTAAMGDELDPLQMTHVRQTSKGGPDKKRPRTIPTTAATVEDIPVIGDPVEENLVNEAPAAAEVIIEEDRHPLGSQSVRVSQPLIHDPSVFVMEEEGGEEEDLLDNESDLSCASLSEEVHQTSHPDRQSAAVPSAALAELSYYRNFANMTIDSLDSWHDRKVSPARPEPPPEDDNAFECISVSDSDSLTSFTPPKAPPPATGRSAIMNAILRQSELPMTSDNVLDSTLASEIMDELRRTHPIVRHPCCGVQTEECLCRLRRELQRRQERWDQVWDRWRAGIAKIRQRFGIGSDDQHEPSGGTLEEKFDELHWRLLHGKLEEESFLFAQDGAEVSRRRSAIGVTSGHYPETPSIAFLAENYRSYLLEQLYVDNSPPPGASLPETPRITLLIANKLATDSGTRWQLDCADECDGLLLLRHRTLRSFVLSVQIQPPRGRKTGGGIEESPSENWRIERIQVREYPQGFVNSPKLLLAHIEFMRLAKETTEQTLRSTYRTVSTLMGLWQRFDELLRRVFDTVNRLLMIVRNNEAMLCYDRQIERFCVTKYFHHTHEDGSCEPNLLLVQFNCVASIGAPGVGFELPVPEPQKLLPAVSTGVVGASGTDDQSTGLMFLECLLWNVTKQFEA
uniref:Uncharacterized protein n=1 Tax=Anopheles farauti TaxID=69004 RepID=A0A182Q4K1_9DIPT